MTSPSSPIASSSRLPDTPPRSSRSSRRPSRRRLARSAVLFVLALCLPYAASSPLPEESQPGPSRHNTLSQDTLPPSALSAMEVLHATAQSAAHHLVRRFTPSDPTRPTLTLASYDPIAGMYRIPQGYVTLVQRFNGGFIVLSYAIAFVGSLCTLELLIRRTNNSGWRNQALLGTAGITFGAVSTFAMHFIFNNSLSLHHPLHNPKYPGMYLSYRADYTILSLVASCSAMTIAFFVMGTHLEDWYCTGRRRRRGSGSSSSDSNHQGATDEYGNWKSAHKALRRGTMGVGALLVQAGAVAKWSLVDPGEGSEEQPGWRSALRKMSGKEEKEGGASSSGNADEDVIKSDKKLEEIDFRFGRSAVKYEMQRRVVDSAVSMEMSPTHGGSSIRLMPSNASIPRTPQPAFYPHTTRQGPNHYEPDPATSPTSEVFTPGFNFPPRTDNEPNSSTASLLPKFTLNSSTSTWRPSSPDFSQNSLPRLPDMSQRRASLPTAILSSPKPEPSSHRVARTLTRIQSLPEADQELSSNTRPSSFAKKDMGSSNPKSSMTAQLTALNESEPSPPERKVRIARRHGMSKFEKFLGLDIVTVPDIIKVFITGTIAGFGVAAMHYIGQFSIKHQKYIAYKAPYVVGSVIIASGAVIIALYIMFIMLRPKLKHGWIAKIIVAAILAIAVCGMHFCGMMGTIYCWPSGESINDHGRKVGDNRPLTAIVATLAFLACLGCVAFFYAHSRRLQRERARRRRVVVAAIFLDDNDRVLVDSTDGLLPMCDIASLTGSGDIPGSKRSVKSGFGSISSDSTVLGMDLTTGHDAFVSALKMSWSWRNPSASQTNTAITDAEEGQAAQTTLAGTMADIRRGSLVTIDSSGPSARQIRLSVTKFLERFAISSGQLATRLVGQQDGISRLGVLYDQILTTGWVKLHDSNDTVSKGQLIFLVRRVTSPNERTDLLSRHYIFAEPQAVANSLQKTLSVPYSHTMPLLEDIRVFCDSTMRMSLKPATLYAGVAVVQATPFDGLRLLLEQDNRSQLPMREICPLGPGAGESPNFVGTLEELGEAITWLDGMSLLSVITRNMTLESETLGGPKVSRLLGQLERAIIPMLDDMLTADDMAHILPRLFLHPVLVPLTPGGSSKPSQLGGYIPSYIIVFYANYDAAVNTFTDKWLPFSLFRAQNACVMAQKIQAVTRAEQIVSGNAEVPPAEYNYQRRPSKVQFEFPLQGSTAMSLREKEASPCSSPNDVIPGSAFSGFTFPALHNDETSINRNLSIKSDRPRRSSLAPTQRFNSNAAENGHIPLSSPDSLLDTKEGQPNSQIQMRPHVELAPGIAMWDPDWLFVLLRTKLRADT